MSLCRIAIVLMVAASSGIGCGRGHLSQAPDVTPKGTTLPTLSVPTTPCNPTANADNVGASCTKGGNQCANTGAPFCTLDYATVADAFCTKLCSTDTDCGAGATCAGDPSVASLKACIPNSCLGDANAIVTGTTGDANGTCPPLEGNSDGVGDKCTAGGGQCRDTGAPYCSVDYIQTPYAFCTKECSSDSDCGDGALCASDPNEPSLRVCLPDGCASVVGPGGTGTTAPTGTQACVGEGNNKGVGQACTSGKNECPKAASVCTGDLGADTAESFCTAFCKRSSDCGDDAVCVADPAWPFLSACLPNACLAQ